MNQRNWMWLFAIVLLASVSSLTYAGASRVSAGDVNGDGLDDLLIVTGSFMQIAIASGDGQFTAGKRILLDPGTPVDAVMADLSGLGQPSFFAAFSDLGGMQHFESSSNRARRYYGYGAGLSRIEIGINQNLPPFLYASYDETSEGFLFRYDSAANLFAFVDKLPYTSSVSDVSLQPFMGNPENDLALLFNDSLALYTHTKDDGFLVHSEIPLTDSLASHISIGPLSGASEYEIVLWKQDSITLTNLIWQSGTDWISNTFSLSESVHTLDVGDVDGDGFADIPSITSAKDEIVFHSNLNGASFTSTSLSLPFVLNEEDEIAVVCGSFATQSGFVVAVPDADGGPVILFVPVESGVIASAVQSSISMPDETPSLYASVIVRDVTNPELYYWSEMVPGWTVGVSLIGNNLTVSRETDTTDGLTTDSDRIINSVKSPLWPADVSLVINQEDTDRSIFSLQRPFSYNLLRTLAYPAGGTYGWTVRVTLESREDAETYYRKDSGSWQLYEPGVSLIYFHRDGILETYSVYGTHVGPVITETYVIEQDYDADSDYDGVPDFIEHEYGLDLFDGVLDSDGDGWRDLHEIVRETDPSDALSFPEDSDPYPVDAENPVAETTSFTWSDFDETLRQTDPNDPDSIPVATGVEIPEAVIPVSVSEAALTIASGSDGARIEAKRLTGNSISSVTLETSTSLRLPVAGPQIIGYTDPESEIILLAYSSRQSFDPQIEGDESTSAEEWITAYQYEMQSKLFENRATLTVNAESTAAVLALGHFMERASSLAVPNIIWSASGTLTEPEILELEQIVDLDEVAEYIAQNIAATSLPSLVRTYIGWANQNDIKGNIVEQIAWILHGWQPEDNPPETLLAKTGTRTQAIDISAIDFQAIRDEITTLLEDIPTRELTLEGTIAWNDDGYASLTQDSVIYGLDDDGASLPDGAQVRIEGHTVTPSPIEDVVWVEIDRVEILENITIASNDTDQNGNGLADQWEDFYFPTVAQLSASDDSDGDGYSNQQEYDGFSDPTDANSIPGDSTSIHQWMIY